MTSAPAAPAADVRPRWGRAFLIALGTHLLPGVLLVWWIAPTASPPAPPPAGIMLELAPMPSAPDSTASDAVPAPPAAESPPPEPVAQPKREPERPRQPERRQPVVKELPKRPKAEAALPAESAAPPAQREPAESRPLAAEAAQPPPAAQVSDRMAAPAVGASASRPSTAVQTWQSLLYGHLERHKRYPSRARRLRQEGVPLVRFVMDRDGRLVTVRLEHPCGTDSLDEEAVALIQRAQPFPPPPQEIPGDRVELVVPVDFSIRSRN